MKSNENRKPFHGGLPYLGATEAKWLAEASHLGRMPETGHMNGGTV